MDAQRNERQHRRQVDVDGDFGGADHALAVLAPNFDFDRPQAIAAQFDPLLEVAGLGVVLHVLIGVGQIRPIDVVARAGLDLDHQLRPDRDNGTVFRRDDLDGAGRMGQGERGEERGGREAG